MQRPSDIENIYERLGVSRSSLTREHLDFMYRQKCTAWSPHMNTRTGSFDELAALKQAYKDISYDLETKRMIEIARQEAAKSQRPVGKRGAMTIETVQCLRQAAVEAHISEYTVN